MQHSNGMIGGEIMTLRDRQAEEAKQLIVDAALRQFLSVGYVATSMDEIATRAGVARRTIYNHFDSKAALLIATIRDRVEARDVRSIEADHQAIASLEDSREIIVAFVSSQAKVVERSIPLIRIALEAAAVDGDVAKEFERNEEARFEAQQVLVDLLAAKRHLRTDVPEGYLRRGFWLLAGPRTAIAAFDAGWEIETYSQWLFDTVSGLLLRPGSSR